MINTMERRVASIALTFGIAAGAVILTGCATPEARISKNPEIYQRLSPRDQALVSQGQIRPGMTMDPVWLAWGTPDQKIPGERRGRLPKRGCTCVTTHLFQATACPTITAHSIGRTSRRSSLTCPRGSLSLMAELFSSNTCRHRRHKAGEGLRSYSASIRISYRQRHAESRRCTVSLAK